jgi:two-component system, NtrC family, sensor histidine kinase KinB
MFGLRQKLSLGFIGLLLIMIVVGVTNVRQIDGLSRDIGMILQENYRSVIACQEMKKALERIDSGVLLTLLGYERKGDKEISDNIDTFLNELELEKNNITIAGEGERVDEIERLFKRYTAILKRVKDVTISGSARQDVYFKELYPLFKEIVSHADEIIKMNQENMIYQKLLAQKEAEAARKQMYLYLLIGSVVAFLWMFLTRQWVLRPINRLITAADDIRRGNLDLTLQSDSRDEIGRLSDAFNEMAASLRDFRRTDRAKLIRMQRSGQEAFKNLTEAVVIVNLQGIVELSTGTAQETFGLKPNVSIRDLPFPWMTALFEEVLKKGRPVEPPEDKSVIQHFVNNKERYYRPGAFPITSIDKVITGVILRIEDITQLRLNDEMKRGMISTVSHQLKTPLTSLRMAIHLLLDERTGTLGPKQEELLIAARDDSERLNTIIDDLLNIGRIQSGKIQIERHAVSPYTLIMESIDKFRTAALDAGIHLRTEVPADLPDVIVDPSQICHVFENLLSNAVKFTAAGGDIVVSSRKDKARVYLTVSDTGIGIPSEYQDRIFDQFFTRADNREKKGAGLGLYIAREALEANGGTIEVKSKPNEGSLFTVSLKRADAVKKRDT